MYLLFLDESGVARRHTHFILGGLAIFEGELYPLRASLDGIMQHFFPHAPQTTLHASELFTQAAHGKIEGFTRSAYRELMRKVAELLHTRHYASGHEARPGVVLFGQVIERAVLAPEQSPYVEAFEGVVARFHRFLQDLERRGNPQKGIVVLATSKRQDHEALRRVFLLFREQGTRLGYISNIPLIPLFTEARATRFLQLADYVAYALSRAYERDDWQYLRPLVPMFYQREGVFEGLYHRTRHYRRCSCPACVSRRRRFAAAASGTAEHEPPRSSE